MLSILLFQVEMWGYSYLVGNQHVAVETLGFMQILD